MVIGVLSIAAAGLVYWNVAPLLTTSVNSEWDGGDEITDNWLVEEERIDEVRLALLSLIDRRSQFVKTLVAAAPLLGLLGTVLGMLQTFFGISTSGGGETAGVVASGISEALVTTQTGLTIALPGLFIVMLIQRKRQALEAQLARLESLTLSSGNFQ